MRYAIDRKPTIYKSLIDGNTYSIDSWDWREIIYQMALDYYRNNSKDDFYVKLRENNIVEIDGEKVQLYPTRFMSESRILQTRSLPDKKLSL